MISRKPARAASSPNVETRCDVGGGCLPTLWCEWNHTSWCEVLVRGKKGKSISTSHLLAQQLYMQTGPPLLMVYRHFALLCPPSLPHTWAEWVQKPAWVNPQGARHAAVSFSGRHWQGRWKKSALGKQKDSGQQGHAVWPQIQGRQLGDHIFLCSLRFQVCFNGFRSCPLLTTVVFISCLFHLDLDITSFLVPLLLLGSLG